MVSIFNVCQTVLDSENSQTVEANQRVKTEQIKNFPAIAWYIASAMTIDGCMLDSPS
jgi:hypothetical protein